MNTLKNERGSAGAKFVIAMIFIGLLAHAGFNFIPAMYNNENFKTDIHTTLLQANSMPNSGGVEGIKARLRKQADNNDVPKDAIILVDNNNGNVKLQVKFTRVINVLPFGLFKYNYQFDHTEALAGFLLK